MRPRTYKTSKIKCKICNNYFIVKRKVGDICKKCQKTINDKKYYGKNKEKLIKYSIDYKRKNNSNKKYYNKNKEKLIEKSKKYYLLHREKILQNRKVKRRKLGILPNGFSGPELIIKNLLIELFPNEKIEFHNRKIIKYKNHYLELDFYLPNKKIAIEIQGPTHYSPIFGQEKYLRTIERDNFKIKECKKLEIKLYQIKVDNGIHYERDKKMEELKNKFLKIIKFRDDNEEVVEDDSKLEE